MGNNSISHKIDAYAQANLKALKQEEAKTGRKMTKFDIAQYMLQHGKLNKNEYANWMNTSEGFNAQAMTQAQKTALRQGSVWGFAGYGGGQESYLDSMTSFAQKNPVKKQNAISGHQMKLNETVAERKKKAAEMNNYIKNQRVLNYKKTADEQRFKAHIDSVKLSEVDANKTASQLTREIEQQDVEMMSHDDRKKFIMDKFQDAAAKKDISGMKNALLEFNSYMCKYIDDKVGVTDAKEAIKEYSGLNALVDYVDKKVDDGDDTNLSNLELAWNITKGMGDAIDGFIGAEGLEMVGALGVASKVATVANVGKYFAVATQGYFGVEGSQLIGAGLAHAQTAETEDEARLAGSEIGMGSIMLGGAVKSAKQGYRNIKIKESDAFAREYVKTANDQALVDEYNARENYGVTVSLDIYKNELIKRGYKPNENGYFETPKPTRPSTYRDELPTPDYSKTRENFPADAHQSLSKPGKATAYTTDGKPDGIVYQGKDGKMYVPNKWDPEHPYEVSTGADGKPASVIMIYDEAGGDFAVGDPTTIASTYKNPATGKLDPLYHAETGKANAMEIVKDQVPSAYKIVKPGTEIQTKEGPRVVQDGEIVVYDTDGDPYVMPKKNFLKRQEPLKGDAESEALYAKLKNGEAIPDTEIATSGNATKPSAKTFTLKAVTEEASKSETPSADFASKLADTKIPRKKLGVTVKTKLTQEEINNLIENCQHGFITDGKPIPNYEARIEAVLNNPKELAIIAECKNTVAGIWRAIQDPLDSTFEKNPELFADTKVKITPDSNVAKTSIKADIDPDAQLRTKLTEFKGPNGKAFLSKPEVENLIEKCQHGFITDGKPIPNYEAKIEAVLNNPEEVASISSWKSRSAGIWRAIQDPLSSTVEANPELFGAKPKAEVKAGNNTAKANVGNSSIENLKAFFEDPKYECMSDFLKNKDILTNNDVIKTDIITDAYGDKLPVIITKIPLKTESGTIPAGSQLRIHAGTLNIGKDIDYSNVKVSLGQVLKNGEWSDAITIQLDMSKDKATITQLNYMTDTYGYAGGLYLNAFPDLAAIIAKSAKTTVEATPEAFGAKPKAEVKTDIKTQTKSSSMSPDIRNSLIEDLKNVKYDKQVTIDTMDQYPKFVEELVNFKVDGKQFFSMREVNDIIYNCLSGNDGLKTSPERIRKVLNNPSEISFMRDECKSKAVGLWVALFR